MAPDLNDPWRQSPAYPQHWVYLDGRCHRGWDGVMRLILRDGTVIPPLPKLHGPKL